jgi:hypothetical protein
MAHGMTVDYAPDAAPPSLDDLIAERDALVAGKDANNNVMATCKAQIEAAKARVTAGEEYADPKWFAAVNSRARYAGREDQRLAHRIGELNRQIGVARSLAHQGKHSREGDDTVALLLRALDLIKQAINVLKGDQP